VAHERRPALAHGTYIPSPVPASVAAGRDGRGWTVEQLASCFPRTFPPTRSSVPDDTRLTCIRPFIRPPPVHTRRRVHFFFFGRSQPASTTTEKTTHHDPSTRRARPRSSATAVAADEAQGRIRYGGDVSSRKGIRRRRRMQWANSRRHFL